MCDDTSEENTNCLYTQTETGMPVVTGISKSTTSTITVSGTDFLSSSDYDGLVTYGGVESDSVTINSDTELVATFNNGVPIVLLGEMPCIEFVSKSSDLFTDVPDQVHFAKKNDQSLTNPLVSSSPSTL